MKITKAKIYEACSKDKDREVLTGVYYDHENQRLIAADGFILAVCPIEKDTDAEQLPDYGRVIQVEAIKQAQKKAGKGERPSLWIEEETANTVGGVRYEHVTRAPLNWDDEPTIIDDYPDVGNVTPKEEDVEFLCALDAQNLLRVAKAICEDHTKSPFLMVKLYQGKTKSSPVLVKPHSTSVTRLKDENYGVLMPVWSSEIEREVEGD